MDNFKANFRVRPTSRVAKLGENLPITDKQRLEIIASMRELKFWPGNKDEFDYCKAFGVWEFKFNKKDHWVRAFVHEDNDCKMMIVIHVLVKKTNALTKADEIAVSTALKSYENEKAMKKDAEAKLEELNQKSLKLYKGGAS